MRIKPFGAGSFAGKVLSSTGYMDTVAILLGHSSIDCSQRHVDVSHDTLCEMFVDAIEAGEC
jgi:site-specific recombinase XerC